MTLPCLLYVYPWMPFPRRLMVYLRERDVPSSIVQIVPVTDYGAGDSVIVELADKVPPRPVGSLPILAIPTDHQQSAPTTSLSDWHYLGESGAIMQYLDATVTGPAVKPALSTPQDPYEAALLASYKAAVENLMPFWNPVRLFGSKASPVKECIPVAAKESLDWLHRELASIEAHLDPDTGRDLDQGGYRTRLSRIGTPNHGDIMLLSFLELVDELFGRFDELTCGQEAGKDAYGRQLERKGWYPHIRELYALWKERPSAARPEGEAIPEYLRMDCIAWADGVWS